MSKIYLRTLGAIALVSAFTFLIVPEIISNSVGFFLFQLGLPYHSHAIEDWWTRSLLFSLLISIGAQCFDLATHPPTHRKWMSLLSTVFALPFALLIGFAMTTPPDMVLFFLFVISFVFSQIILFIRQRSLRKER